MAVFLWFNFNLFVLGRLQHVLQMDTFSQALQPEAFLYFLQLTRSSFRFPFWDSLVASIDPLANQNFVSSCNMSICLSYASQMICQWHLKTSHEIAYVSLRGFH